MRSLVFLMLFLAGGFSVFAQTPPDAPACDEAALKKAVQTLMVSGLDQNSLNVLLAYSRDTAQADPYLRSRTMAAYALSAFAKSDTNLFERARLAHQAAFPKDTGLITVKLADAVKPCASCNGVGYTEAFAACNMCKGSGRCTTCKGTGKWQAVAAADTRLGSNSQRQNSSIACSKCRATGICPSCSGQQSQRTRCAACEGKGSVLEIPKERVTADFTAALGQIILAIDRDAALAQKIADAKTEPNITKRMAACQALMRELKGHPELKAIENLLDDDKLTLQKKAEQERAEQIASEKELAMVRNFQNSPSPVAGASAVRKYLEENPNSPHRMEAQIVLENLLAKIEAKHKKERLFYMVGGAIFILAALSCLHISVFRYNLYSHDKTMPRSDRPARGGTDFTDPLSLNAKDSRNRVKRRTARIPISDVPRDE